MPRQGTRLTIVQYAGDFREASERLSRGGPETYRGQRYTVEYVEKLTQRLDAVTIITGFTDEAYDVVLPSGARAIGAGFTNGFDGQRIAQIVDSTAPDLLILRSPIRPVLWWAVRKRCRTLVLLADSFNETSLKGRASQAILSMFLRSRVFDWVANHGHRAAEQLVKGGVSSNKVLPWDFPAFDTPRTRAAKLQASKQPRILYVGAMSAEKGVDDLIVAAKLLHKEVGSLQVDLVGKLDAGRISELISKNGLTGVVNQVGPVMNSEVVPLMARADVVVVPSRYDFPEGMPLTIYEAFCSRTPLVASDHPMFVGNVINEESGLLFKAGQADDLAAQIRRLLDNPSLYNKVSEGGLASWERLQIPLKWADLIDHWLEDSAESRSRLAAYSMASNYR
ncbi:glycosyltransferase family 4 protein [Microvirga sp. HBU67558]|uniref:glycosyltransferase family 4 protein n=1 Tax=Microvirga TaxID=186650 RepID=UPI001B399F3E|nr:MULTISPECIES: glycosyltransferase family 4 protein [unclassified Microvirga]MBQ0820529.1 glycosyltransferase family 4 protein [Microvirga sp. HBU67558]